MALLLSYRGGADGDGVVVARVGEGEAVPVAVGAAVGGTVGVADGGGVGIVTGVAGASPLSGMGVAVGGGAARGGVGGCGV
ncbi:MAG: hypothetical protein IRZ14_17585 [Chloroflexi bacterium]|nr:hypothetical protein [Chloroflexota bacterium]